MKGLLCALFIIVLACAQPTSSRAYIPPYVPPQPPAERHKIVKTFKAVITRYIKPKREDYKSKKTYLEALKLNGTGKKTFFGTPPKADFTIAADVIHVKNGLKRGTIKRGTIVKIKGEGINLTGEVDDRCVAAGKLWKKKGMVQFDVFAKMSQKQADAWGKREMTVEILQPI